MQTRLKWPQPNYIINSGERRAPRGSAKGKHGSRLGGRGLKLFSGASVTERFRSEGVESVETGPSGGEGGGVKR